MKKIFAGLLLLITTIGGITAFNFFEKPTDIFASPTGKYKVELYGNKERPWLPFSKNPVTAEIFFDDKPFASTTIHTSYWLESSFEQTYQKYVWIADNILSFRGIANPIIATEENGDSLQIVNKTDCKIRFLKIGFSANKFLILDFPRDSAQTVFTNHSKAYEYITVEGEFVNGKQIDWEGLNFSENSKQGKVGSFKYIVSVEEDKVLIERL